MLVIGIQNCLDLDTRFRTAGKGREGAGRGSTWRILVTGEAPGDGDHGTWGRATAAADTRGAERTRGHGRENMRARDGVRTPVAGSGDANGDDGCAGGGGGGLEAAPCDCVLDFFFRMGVSGERTMKGGEKKYRERNRWILFVK